MITLEPSATPSRLLALTTPFSLRARSSSHQPKRKSRAMSLNHGVNELPITITSSAIIIRPMQTSAELSRTLLLEHRLQLCLIDVLVVANLIRIRRHRHVRGQKEDVIDCTRPERSAEECKRIEGLVRDNAAHLHARPTSIRRREIVYPRQVLELVYRRLLARDPELVFEFP